MDVGLHNVVAIELLPISHFPPSNECEEFWNRKIVVTTKSGELLTLTLYGDREALGIKS